MLHRNKRFVFSRRTKKARPWGAGPAVFSPCFGMLRDKFGVGWMVLAQG